MNWRRNVNWIIKAGGHVVPELNVRGGRRLALHRENKKQAARRRAALRKIDEESVSTADLHAVARYAEEGMEGHRRLCGAGSARSSGS